MIKQHSSTAMALVCFLCTASMSIAGDFLLVKEVNYLGEEEYKTMDKKQYMDTVRQIKAENMVWTQAQRLAEQEWNKTPHACRYPGRSLHRRQVKIYRHYRTEAEAQSEAMKKSEMIRREQQKKEDRERQREYNKNRYNRGGGRRNNRNGGGYSNTSRGRKRQREAERKEQTAEASSIFATQVQNLLAERERIKAEHDARMAAEAAGKSYTPPSSEKKQEPTGE